MQQNAECRIELEWVKQSSVERVRQEEFGGFGRQREKSVDGPSQQRDDSIKNYPLR